MALNGVRLFCFDFDETITEKHMHHFLRTSAQLKPGAPLTPEIMEICLKICKLKNPDLMFEAIKKIINQGNLVAIVSYNGYPDMILYTLKKLGLSESELSKIKISTGFPTQEGNIDLTGRKKINYEQGKEIHIAHSLAWAEKQGFSINPEEIILIDDDPKNIEIAKHYGHKTIQVPKIDRRLDLDYLVVELAKYIGEYDPQLIARCKEDLTTAFTNNILIEKLLTKQKRLDDRYEEYLTLMNGSSEMVDTFLKIKNKRYLYAELARLCCRHTLMHPTLLIQFDHILEEALGTKQAKAFFPENVGEKIKNKILR